MKIALVTWAYDQYQGIGKCTFELSKRLAKAHEVHIFAPSWEGGSTSIVFHKVPIVNRGWYGRVLSFFLTSAWLLRQDRFDIIHLHAPSYHNAHVVSCHSVPVSGINYLRELPLSVRKEFPAMWALPHRVLRPVYAYNFRDDRQRKAIAISSRIRSDLIDYYHVALEKILLIPNGVDLDTFHPSHRRRFGAAVRAEYGIPQESFVFLLVAHDLWRKGLQFILKAMQSIATKGVCLLVVGGAETDAMYFRRMAEALGINAFLVFTGFQKETSRFYAAADCFVLPSLYEPYGLVLLEAMASGMPVIAARTVGAATDLIEDGKNGLLVNEPWHIEDLALKMDTVMRCEEIREELRRNAREVAEQYSWDRNADRTLQAYTQILG